VPGGFILDYPRYAYRAAMLDLARHFFEKADVERYIDEIALYKINYLHLHLTDDQGWRIAIDGLPALTGIGGSTGEAGFLGGYLTKADYREIVAYAQDRNITVVPEIEGPAHENAALASLPQLNCDGTPPELYINIGVSPDGGLCTDFEPTYRFLDMVVGQLAALTPGPYLNIGGDEATFISPAEYARYVKKAQEIVLRHGKRPIGWQETLSAADPKTATGIYWAGGLNDDAVVSSTKHGAHLVLAPATHVYLDMRYSEDGPPEPWLGLNWAGFIDVRDSYSWDPATFVPGVPASAVLGVEAPLWTDTVYGEIYFEEMSFPRLPAVAELGWSPSATHNWAGFQARLAAQGPRWDAMGMYWFHSTQIAWPSS
jgi:N-acetyl-beta-hexosaminidase